MLAQSAGENNKAVLTDTCVFVKRMLSHALSCLTLLTHLCKRQDKGDHPHYTDENSEAQGDGKLLKTVPTLSPRDKSIPGF